MWKEVREVTVSVVIQTDTDFEEISSIVCTSPLILIELSCTL
jgi:hypothetical protein